MKFSSFEWGDASEEEEESVRSEKWLDQSEGIWSQRLLTDHQPSICSDEQGSWHVITVIPAQGG